MQHTITLHAVTGYLNCALIQGEFTCRKGTVLSKPTHVLSEASCHEDIWVVSVQSHVFVIFLLLLDEHQ